MTTKSPFLPALCLIGGLASAVAPATHADPINVGFETGDFAGWALNAPGLSSVLNDYTAMYDGRSYGPPDGTYFALLTAGLAGIYTTASQTFTMEAGDTLSGWAAFDAGDYLPYNDDAAVTIAISTGNIPLWSKDVAAVGNYGSSAWEAWSYTALVDGPVTLTYGVRNYWDNAVPSAAVFDTKFDKSVPDGGAMIALVGSGMLALALFRRRLG